MRETTGSLKVCECGGLQHLRDPETGKWQECPCLTVGKRYSAYEKARIPREYWDVRPGDFPNTVWSEPLRAYLYETAGGRKPGMRSVLLYGCSETARTLGMSLLARSAIDAGDTALLVRSQRLVDAHFARGEEPTSQESFRGPVFLGIYLGEEIPNSLTGAVVLNLYLERRDRGKVTAFAFAGMPDQIQDRRGYGSTLAATLRDRRLFQPICVR